MGGQGSALLSTSPATSALSVNLASNFGPLNLARQQLRCSPSTSPAISVLSTRQPRQQLRRSRSTSPAASALPATPASSALNTTGNLAGNLDAPCQPRQQNLALRVNLASNFGAPAPGQPRQQLRRSLSTFASNFGAPGQPSPATSALPVNLRQQLRRSVNLATNFGGPVNLAGNFGAPGQPRQQLRCSWPTSPATSSLPAKLASALPVNLRQQLRQPRQALRCSQSTHERTNDAKNMPFVTWPG